MPTSTQTLHLYASTTTTTTYALFLATPGATPFPTLTNPSTPPSLLYTTLLQPAPTFAAAKYFPNPGLPILVLTELNAFVLDISNPTTTLALTTITVSPTIPPQIPDYLPGGRYAVDDVLGQKLWLTGEDAGGWGWGAWTGAERGGVLAAALAGMFLLIGVAVVGWRVRKRGRRWGRDMERGPDLVGKERKRRGWRSFGGGFMSGRKRMGKGKEGEEHEGGIEGLEGIEMGRAAMRVLAESGRTLNDVRGE